MHAELLTVDALAQLGRQLDETAVGACDRRTTDEFAAIRVHAALTEAAERFGVLAEQVSVIVAEYVARPDSSLTSRRIAKSRDYFPLAPAMSETLNTAQDPRDPTEVDSIAGFVS